MRVTTFARYDMASWTLEDWRGYEYCGPVEECKGEGTSKDQLALQNKMVADQTAKQDAIRQQIMGGVGKYLTGSGEGFDPAQLAAMTSAFLNNTAGQYGGARSNVISALASRGIGTGSAPGGGDIARDFSGLEGAAADTRSQGILGINIQNLQQALANRFNAANVASGQTAQIGSNIGTFNAGANNALNQYMQAANSGFGASFMRGLGGGLGGAVAGIATGGIGASLGGLSKFLSKAPSSSPPAYAPGFSQTYSEGYT